MLFFRGFNSKVEKIIPCSTLYSYKSLLETQKRGGCVFYVLIDGRLNTNLINCAFLKNFMD